VLGGMLVHAYIEQCWPGESGEWRSNTPQTYSMLGRSFSKKTAVTGKTKREKKRLNEINKKKS